MKHFKLLSLTFLLVSLHTFSICQYSKYRIGPEIETLIPFTKHELQQFKEKKIQKVEVKSNLSDERIIYYLNEKGQVILEESIYKHKKKEINYYKVLYKYNQNGLLTIRDANGPFTISYDSIAYDDKGRIIHYYSYQIYPTYRKKNRVPEVEYNMNLFYADENKVILFDSSQFAKSYYTFNNQNKVILRYLYDHIDTTNIIDSEYRIDSVSIDTINETEYVKKYWHKENTDSIFSLGKEYTYKNGFIQTETEWERYFNGVRINYKTYYTYDQKNQLLKTENENRYQRKKFYTYDKWGFVMEEIIVEHNYSYINYYYYKRFENTFD
jgi:hypothetical protein